MRNAGRKKSHPVWEFFKDLKDTNGIGGVICLHCSWQGDDRSPNNLRTHLKKFHSTDGVFAKFSEKLAQGFHEEVLPTRQAFWCSLDFPRNPVGNGYRPAYLRSALGGRLT
ncbi:unnamed protein product [Heligmosomoides polygyrus]|uniref:BED-type domain-containing protein n=1 Tax=Heligmosomoides polygyrus TaxID=6339 RepID=A0A3P7XSF3_HELPZ|nr:unnamed protein product [Heligmosomoides polygyrus]